MSRIYTKNVSFSRAIGIQKTAAGNGDRRDGKYAVKDYDPNNYAHSLANRLLAAEAAAPLAPHVKSVVLENEDFVYQSGDRIDDVYFPENAVISEYKMLEDGRTSEIAMIGREGVTGLEVVLNAGTANHWTRVSVAGNAVKIKAEIFKKEFDDNSKFREVILNYVSNYLAQTSQKVICNCYHLIEKRLSGWLLMLGDRSGKNNFAVTHEQLAQFLGVQRPSITRTTQILRKKGAIDYERGNIWISDAGKLEDSACSCYRQAGIY